MGNRSKRGPAPTLSIALDGITVPLNLPVPESARRALLAREDLRAEGVPVPKVVALLWREPTLGEGDARHARLTDASTKGSDALIEAVVDLVMEFVADGTDRRVVQELARRSTPTGMFQLQSFLLTGQVPDPKAHAALLSTLTARVAEQVASRL